jgi:hypothetical protein
MEPPSCVLLAVVPEGQGTELEVVLRRLHQIDRKKVSIQLLLARCLGRGVPLARGSTYPVEWRAPSRELSSGLPDSSHGFPLEPVLLAANSLSVMSTAANFPSDWYDTAARSPSPPSAYNHTMLMDCKATMDTIMEFTREAIHVFSVAMDLICMPLTPASFSKKEVRQFGLEL